MTNATRPRRGVDETVRQAGQALRTWTGGQVLAAIAAAVLVAVVIGTATVLIPNAVFTREIPPVWWNYPAWLLTSALSGMLVATYVRPHRAGSDAGVDQDDDVEGAALRSSRLGMVGGVLAWFAVGCPVCNKLALGYSGAITWFAPVQPFLALGGLILTGVALVWRLRGQAACPVRPRAMADAR